MKLHSVTTSTSNLIREQYTMSIVEVKVPQLSESVTEATLLSWHKQVGEAVEEV